MKPLILISSDCHFGLEPLAYRPYLEQKYHADFDRWIENKQQPHEVMVELERRLRANIGGAEASPFATAENRLVGEQAELAADLKERFPEMSAAETADLVLRSQHHGRPHVSDPELRLKELEADGVVAEVVIPQQGIPLYGDAGLHNIDVTFGIDVGWDKIGPELRMAGARAYHRALAELCSAHPDRRRGLATIPSFANMDAAVAELTWAADNGLRGVLIHPSEPGMPPLYEDYFDPFWAACVDLDMPVHWHVGPSMTTYGTSPYSSQVLGFEIFWWVHRPLWHMIFGGVINRFPGLRLIFTEQNAHWLPYHLQAMDDRARKKSMYGFLPAKPSEIWRSNCFLGASALSHDEAMLKDVIGVETMMFGTDFPHQETTWPHSGAYINRVFQGYNEADLRAVCGENAARAYGFDLERLRPVADRVGHRVEDVLSTSGPLVEEAAKHVRINSGDRFGVVL